MPAKRKAKAGLTSANQTKKAKTYVSKAVKALKDGKPTKKSFSVDKFCELINSGADEYEVFEDYDCMLNQTNVGANNNKYYVIQLIVQACDEPTMGYVWNRWGRVGESGASALKGPMDLEKARKEFTKKFKDKTKNDWENRDNFEAIKGKYTMIEVQAESEEDNDDTVQQGSSSSPSNTLPCSLDKNTQKLIRLIFDEDMFHDSMKQYDLDTKKMPLGKLSKSQIAKGFESLEELESAIKANKKKDYERLTSQFYTLIPHNFGRQRPPLISTLQTIREKMDMLLVLADIELALSMQKGKGTKKSTKAKDPHPYDVNYGLLNCDLELLANSSKEFKVIEAYVEATKGTWRSPKVLHAWRVNRPDEDLLDMMEGKYKPTNRDSYAQDNPVFDVESALSEDEMKPPAPNNNHQDDGYEMDELPTDAVDQSDPSKKKKKGDESWILRAQMSVSEFCLQQQRIIKILFYICLLVAYAVYFVFAMIYSFNEFGELDEGAIRLLAMTAVAVVLAVVSVTFGRFGDDIVSGCWAPFKAFCKKHWQYLKWALYGTLSVLVVVIIVVDVIERDSTRNLVSLLGMFIFLLLFYIFSANPAAVRWRPVFWGMFLQFIVAYAILRWTVGFKIFNWMGERVTEFLVHTNAGSSFVFGADYWKVFAFNVLPIVTFFSTVVNILYYLGVMQVVIEKVAMVMQFTMGTTAGESLNAAGNIFIGMTESPLMIRPILKDLTRSELHAIMTGGFATIAGSVLGIYITFGVPANHLLSASVMSAPAALAVSKLFYPETEESHTTADDVKKMEKSPERNILEAAATGASQSVKLVANIAVNLIAFMALLHFVDATLMWFGQRVGLDGVNYPFLSFNLICSYLFWPLSVILGAALDDCRSLAQLIGTKIFVNEFVAYTEMAVYINNGKDLIGYQSAVSQAVQNISSTINNQTYPGDIVPIIPIMNYTFYNLTWPINVTTLQNGLAAQSIYNASSSFNDLALPGWAMTLYKGVLAKRSEVLATYALCGFSNFAAIGIMVGALSAMAPSKKADITRVVLRAMIAGNVACFLTACVSGLFYVGEIGVG